MHKLTWNISISNRMTESVLPVDHKPMMEPGTSPRKVTSKRSIKYKKSKWSVHEFEVWSGQLVCRMVALKMEESLLLWAGGPEPALGAVALALPAARPRALSTVLLAGGGAGGGGGAGAAAALAARAAARLARAVFVCVALPLDRFTAPLLELGLFAELRRNPYFFYTPASESEQKDDATHTSMRDIPLFETSSGSSFYPGKNIDTQDSVKNESDSEFQQPK